MYYIVYTHIIAVIITYTNSYSITKRNIYVYIYIYIFSLVYIK